MSLIKPDYKKGMVYLVIFPRPSTLPSMSPFGLKLETWLRMQKIQYEYISNGWTKNSKKGQIPFIELNGEQIADSNFIIEQLPKTMGIQSLDAHLTEMERAKLRSLLALIEDKIFWSYYGFISIEGRNVLYTNDLYETAAWYLKPFLGSKFEQVGVDRCKYHGIGRQSIDKMTHLLKTDLKALSMLLGDQEYLMGSRPTSVDAVAFGHLACGFLRHSKQKEVNEMQRFFREDCKNLFAYMKRMIAEYYPDWKRLAPKGIDM